MANKQWSTIYASLLDEKKEPLLAFIVKLKKTTLRPVLLSVGL